MEHIRERERIAREYRAKITTEEDRLRARVAELEDRLAEREAEIGDLVAEAARRVRR